MNIMIPISRYVLGQILNKKQNYIYLKSIPQRFDVNSTVYLYLRGNSKTSNASMVIGQFTCKDTVKLDKKHNSCYIPVSDLMLYKKAKDISSFTKYCKCVCPDIEMCRHCLNAYIFMGQKEENSVEKDMYNCPKKLGRFSGAYIYCFLNDWI